MKITSFLSVCTLALATAVAANHGQYEPKSIAPAHSGAPANKPAHHWAARDAREHEHKHSAHTDDSDKKASHYHESREARDREHEAAHHGGMKPTMKHHYARDAGKSTGRPSHSSSMDEKIESSTKKPAGSKVEYGHHHARDADRKEEHKHKHTEEMKNHHNARDADHKDKHGHSKPEGHPHHARDADRKPKHEPMHTGGAVAGKPGHHLIRNAARPNGRPNDRPNLGSGNFANNPFMGTRFTPGSAITSVRGILTGQSGIPQTCDRCIAAMQVGQSLAQQASAADFSKAVVGLCKQVAYKSHSGCSNAFSVGKVGPYVSTLQNADLGSDGKGFCKQYFGAC